MIYIYLYIFYDCIAVEYKCHTHGCIADAKCEDGSDYCTSCTATQSQDSGYCMNTGGK